MKSKTREKNGRFIQGNPGGPGRPRRRIEREYLATLGDVVSLDDWQQIVARAVSDSKAGDATARNWLTKHLIGENPPTLLALGAMEQRGISADVELDQETTSQQRAAILDGILDSNQI